MASKSSIKVISINKQGNKVIGYVCTDENNSSIELTKEQIVEKINNGEVSNARIQIYKGQIIVRVNLEDKSSNNSEKRKQHDKSKTKKDNKYTKDVMSENLMDVIADVFGIVQYKKEFTQRFFEKHPELVNKSFNSNNVNEKVKAMRLMGGFWKLVAYNQADRTYKILMESADNIEYDEYCKANGIIDKEE